MRTLEEHNNHDTKTLIKDCGKFLYIEGLCQCSASEYSLVSGYIRKEAIVSFSVEDDYTKITTVTNFGEFTYNEDNTIFVKTPANEILNILNDEKENNVVNNVVNNERKGKRRII